MIHKVLLIFICFIGLPVAYADQDRIGVLHDKISTLVFNEEIVDVELGSQAYHVKVKGRYLLLRAKNKDVPPTSLFVRYGKKTQHYYVTEIYPDAKAPLQYSVQIIDEKKAVKPDHKTPIPFTDTDQEYFDIGVIQHGVKTILNKILHTPESTCIQVFVENTSSIDLCLKQWTFEYVTILSRGIFTKKTKRKLVEPITAPASVIVPAKSAEYIVFSIPTYMGTEGLEISLEEGDGERIFKFLIPSKVLLKAKKII